MNQFKNILCIVGKGETDIISLQRAVDLAEGSEAKLTVAELTPEISAAISLPQGGPDSVELQNALANEHRRDLDTLLTPFRDDSNIQTRILQGTPFLQIIREVLRNGHDLVISVPENPDWLDRLFGSDDMHLLRKCPCPVWFIKPEARKRKRIVAAVDVSDEYTPEELDTRRSLNLQTLEIAISLALSDHAELHIAHAWTAIGEVAMYGPFMRTPEAQITAYVEQIRKQREAALDTLVKQVTAQLGQDMLAHCKPHTHLIKGPSRKEIPALLRRLDPDLVVMGTVARTGVPGFIMGNTAETILNQIDCSVLAIKPAGFVTPVTLEE
jgi:universal stress protein E